MTSGTIRKLVEQGKIDEATEIRREAEPIWRRAGQMRGLFAEKKRIIDHKKQKPQNVAKKRKLLTLADIMEEQEHKKSRKHLARVRTSWAAAVILPLCLGLFTAWISRGTTSHRFGLMLVTTAMLWLITISHVIWEFHAKYREHVKGGLALLACLLIVAGSIPLGIKYYKDNEPKWQAADTRNQNRDALLALADQHRPDLEDLKPVATDVSGPMVIVHLPPGSRTWELHPHNDKLPNRFQTGNPDEVELIAYVKTRGMSRSKSRLLHFSKGGSYYFDSWEIWVTIYDIRQAKTMYHGGGIAPIPKSESAGLNHTSDGMPGSRSGFSEDGKAYVRAYDEDQWVANHLTKILTK